MEKSKNIHKKISISIPEKQLKKIDELRNLVSRSKFISYLVETAMDNQGEEEA
ncbi:MAG: hypothetical protein IS860_01720 [Nitrosopumilus sp.]|nr:hypothetical protein [Nitrosopumilus sp.]MCE2505584.1 hypothetical protein [Nitrosopumilaceae archaeon]